MVNFSERNFTFWKDRLPALSGIAENYESITGDISIVGLWQQSLIQDLLWIRMGPIAPKAAREIEAAGLPSWSWMSCPSRIKFDIWQLTARIRQIDRYVRVQEYCKLTDFSVEWAGIPFVSPLKSAYIVLYGPSVEVAIDIEGNLEQSNPPFFTITYLNGHEVCTGQFDRGNVTPGAYCCLWLRSRVHRQTHARREIFMILQRRCGRMHERVGIGCVYGTALFAKATWKTFFIK
jgi:hypothetical protein